MKTVQKGGAAVVALALVTLFVWFPAAAGEASYHDGAPGQNLEWFDGYHWDLVRSAGYHGSSPAAGGGCNYHEIRPEEQGYHEA